MDCVVISDSSESDSDSEGGEAGAAQRSRPSGGGGGSAGKRPKPKPKKKKRQEVEEKPKPRKKAKKGRANESTAWTASEDEGCACSFECTCAKSRDGDGGGSSSAPAQQAQEAWEKWIFSPPATMVFASNLPATPPLYWGDKKGGNEAANLLDSMGKSQLISPATCPPVSRRSSRWVVAGSLCRLTHFALPSCTCFRVARPDNPMYLLAPGTTCRCPVRGKQLAIFSKLFSTFTTCRGVKMVWFADVWCTFVIARSGSSRRWSTRFRFRPQSYTATRAPTHQNCLQKCAPRREIAAAIRARLKFVHRKSCTKNL